MYQYVRKKDKASETTSPNIYEAYKLGPHFPSFVNCYAHLYHNSEIRKFLKIVLDLVTVAVKI